MKGLIKVERVDKGGKGVKRSKGWIKFERVDKGGKGG